MKKSHILIVDDDPAILRLLRTNLKARGYEVSSAANGVDALIVVESNFIDLVVLDIMMPKMDGVEVCRRIREWSQVPIIMLSGRGDEEGIVKCLELGADDYLTKPFNVAELIARINTAFRHYNGARTAPTQSVLRLGDIEINFAARRVMVDGADVRLTPTEYSLLQQLAVNANKVLTHSNLLQSVWGQEYQSETEYLHVFIGRLRKKLEPDPEHPEHIMTVPGVGYCLTGQ